MTFNDFQKFIQIHPNIADAFQHSFHEVVWSSDFKRNSASMSMKKRTLKYQELHHQIEIGMKD